MQTRMDPRGPYRTIATVESTPSAHVITYVECGHTGQHTRHFAAPAPGERDRCFACRLVAEGRYVDEG